MPSRIPQIAAVKKILDTGFWYTLPGLRAGCSVYGVPASEAGISARIRDLRKPKYGGHTIERRKNGSLWEYRLVR